MRCAWGQEGTDIFLCIRRVRVGCCWRLFHPREQTCRGPRWWGMVRVLRLVLRLGVRVGLYAGFVDPYGWGCRERCAGGYGCGAEDCGCRGAAGQEFVGAAGARGTALVGGAWLAAGRVSCGGGGVWAGIVYRGAGGVE